MVPGINPFFGIVQLEYMFSSKIRNDIIFRIESNFCIASNSESKQNKQHGQI